MSMIVSFGDESEKLLRAARFMIERDHRLFMGESGYYIYRPQVEARTCQAS